jgi:hypothetical protein
MNFRFSSDQADRQVATEGPPGSDPAVLRESAARVGYVLPDAIPFFGVEPC